MTGAKLNIREFPNELNLLRFMNYQELPIAELVEEAKQFNLKKVQMFFFRELINLRGIYLESFNNPYEKGTRQFANQLNHSKNERLRLSKEIQRIGQILEVLGQL